MDAKQLKKNLRNPKNADWSTLDPKEVRVGLGPVMTEDQMIEYCKQHGIRTPTIAGKMSLDPPKP
jgi:hypothetical protein